MKRQPNNGANTNKKAFGCELRLIDLFCGCGGFSLGMERAGFRVLAAIDFNAEAIATFRRNLPHVPHALERDLTKFRPQELGKLIGREQVDVIVGGPPCQGFSTARQRDGANHGHLRLVDDERRHLYREFLRYVSYFKPKVFVMENVPGIRTAAGGEFFTRVQKESRVLGYRVHSRIEDAWELGVPQKRRRQLIIGVHDRLDGYFPSELTPSPRAKPHTPLGAAICDLPVLHAGGGTDERVYDTARRTQHFRNFGKDARNYLFHVLEVERASMLTNHVARPHSERDLRDFARLREGENSATAMRDRGVEFEFPYDKSSFKDRYTRQSRRGACSTIVAHLSKDGLMFIHPTQNRSLTPREAARIQSFPDWFQFPTARTHAFRIIGNAVPPLVAESIGLTIKEFLGMQITRKVRIATRQHAEAINDEASDFDLPRNRQVAMQRLLDLSRYSSRELRTLSKEDFRRGWHALLFLFPGIHPDNALDHGNDIERVQSGMHHSPAFGRLVMHRFARSGWPVALEAIGAEAWRRYEAGELAEEEFYCVAALRAGLMVGRVGGSPRQKASTA
ncbi:MAG: DNA cytosine methyltransferase [Pseudomonadota bacterium]